jgi:aryl-alcohol dehydrogenase-like predicted oxidoreductase
MDTSSKNRGLNRREFLTISVLGTTSTVLGASRLAGAVQQYAANEPLVLPKPVHRILGRTGLKITVVSFGAMLTPEPEVLRIAFDLGVNYVDTARKYMDGKNEEIVGAALIGRRDKVYVATKTPPDARSRNAIIRDVEMSLKALGTDYIDIIQLHSLKDKERIFISETREALVKLREQGKVRYFGVTTHKNQPEVLNALVDDKDRFFDMALVAYNFESSATIGEAVARAAKAGIGIVAMKTQAGGYRTQALGGVSPHQAALKWALQNPNVTAAVPSMQNLVHLRENIAVMGMPFTRADRRVLQKYHAAVASSYCDLCGMCEGTCPKRVEISKINRSLMYAEGYRNYELALSTYREIPPPLAASACLDCPVCVASCVRGLNIAAQMDRARSVLAEGTTAQNERFLPT